MADVTLRLPNGNPITVPEDATEEMIREYAIGVGLAEPEDFDTGFSVSGFIKENLDIPLGLGGAAAGFGVGAALGSAVPVVGTAIGGIAGGILGGALGTGAGVVMSDVIEDPEDIDYADAVAQAGLSIGIDLLTLGIGSKIKNMIKTAKAMKYSPEDAARIIADQAQAGKAAGSEESIAATQQILSEGGATLLPSQTGKATDTIEQLESLAQFGVLSGAQMKNNTQNVATVVQDNLTDMLNRQGEDLFMDPAELGENMMKVIDNGKQSLGDVYSFALDQIEDRISPQVVAPVGGLKKALRDFSTSRKDDLSLNLDPDTLKFIQDEITALGQKNTVTVKSLLNFEKRLNKKITALNKTTSSGYNDQAAQELQELSSKLKGTLAGIVENVDPEVAEMYKVAKKTYGEGMESLLPEINASFVRKARKGDFESLGTFLIEGGSAQKINKFMKSIDTAFDITTSAGMVGKGKADIVEGVGFTSAKQAKEAVKQGFVKNLFGDLSGEFNMQPKLAKRYETPKMRAKLAAVLGEDAPKIKQLMNIMAESSTKQGSGFMGLSLAGRQVSAIIGVGSAGTVAGLAGGLGTAGAILLTPLLISMKYTDPKWVNKLIALEKTTFDSVNAKEIALTNFLADTVAGLSTEDQVEFRADVRRRSEQQAPMQQPQQAVGQ